MELNFIELYEQTGLDLEDQWDYEANYPHRPEDFTKGSNFISLADNYSDISLINEFDMELNYPLTPKEFHPLTEPGASAS